MHSSFACVAVAGGVLDEMERPMLWRNGSGFDLHEMILTLDLIREEIEVVASVLAEPTYSQ